MSIEKQLTDIARATWPTASPQKIEIAIMAAMGFTQAEIGQNLEISRDCVTRAYKWLKLNGPEGEQPFSRCKYNRSQRVINEK
jgi:DNA invertase Pin-like site-specific DNA recombinase